MKNPFFAPAEDQQKHWRVGQIQCNANTVQQTQVSLASFQPRSCCSQQVKAQKACDPKL